jgi:hypothetical protein
MSDVEPALPIPVGKSEKYVKPTCLLSLDSIRKGGGGHIHLVMTVERNTYAL